MKKKLLSMLLSCMLITSISTTTNIAYAQTKTINSEDSTENSISPDEYSDWIDDDTAYASADLTFSFIYDGLGITIDDCEIGVWGDCDENEGGWLYE